MKGFSNPLLPVPFGDPDANVYEGKVYAYGKRDRRCRPDANDKSWTAFSSSDLVNWTDHKDIFHMDDIPWAVSHAFAPGAASRDGLYYLYAPCRDKNEQWNTAVGVSSNPEGPFTCKARIEINEYDPCVFIDDDGQAYLYFPGLMARLKDNMYEVEGQLIRRDDYLVGGPLDPEKYGVWENPYLFKKDGKYHYLLSVFDLDAEGNLIWGQKIHHWLGDSPMGPFYYKGLVYYPSRGNCGTSIIEFQGRWYFFYHRPLWSEDVGCVERKACMEPVEFNEDGTIKPVMATLPGTELINARTYSADSGNWDVNDRAKSLQNLHDGDVTTPAAAIGPEAWVEYAFDEPKNIDRVRLHGDKSGHWRLGRWKVMALVDGQWRDALGWTALSSDGWQEITFEPITTSKVRGCFKPGLEDRIELQCFQLFEAGSDATSLPGSPVENKE